MHHAPLSFIESQENTAYSSMHVNSVACASPDYEEITNLPAKKASCSDENNAHDYEDLSLV